MDGENYTEDGYKGFHRHRGNSNHREYGSHEGSEPCAHMHDNFRDRAGFGLKYFILAFADKEKIRGIDVMNRVEEISRGHWRPVPGNVYYELDNLVKKNYLKIINEDGNKYYEITETGKEALKRITNWFPIKSVIEERIRNALNKTDIMKEIEDKINKLENSKALSTEDLNNVQKLKDLLNKIK